MIYLDQGMCRDVDPEVFLPGNWAAERLAKQVCAGCEVRLDCLALALLSSHLDGVWGGLTARERARHTVVHRALSTHPV